MNVARMMLGITQPYLLIETWALGMERLTEYHPCLGEEASLYIHRRRLALYG